jgi:hypothetical protein
MLDKILSFSYAVMVLSTLSTSDIVRVGLTPEVEGFTSCQKSAFPESETIYS